MVKEVPQCSEWLKSLVLTIMTLTPIQPIVTSRDNY